MIETGKTKLNSNLRIGRRIYHLESVTSTNSALVNRVEEAKELPAISIPEGTVLRADEQTAGRGRMNRVWQSPLGKGLWFSAYLRPELELSRVHLITFLAAVAVADAVRNTFKMRPEIKWPNDVLLEKRKFCGILTETRSEKNLLDFAILGIGVNLNQSEAELNSSYGPNATSLRIVLGREIEADPLFTAILEQLNEYYEALKAKRFDFILNKWKEHTSFFGKSVSLVGDNEEISGVARDLDEKGGIILELEDGKERVFYTGSLYY
ncbi:MAG: biotin--[acetyl-CoA-carboxylase] ligase [bacterium]